MGRERAALRELRDARGFSRSFLAQLFANEAAARGSPLTVTERTLQRWEDRDPPTPSLEKLELLAAALGCAVDDLGFRPRPSVPRSHALDEGPWTLDSTVGALGDAVSVDPGATRRDAMKVAVGGLSTFVVHWLTSESQTPPLDAHADPGPTFSTEAVERLERAADELRLRDARIGGSTLLEATRGHLASAHRLLASSARPSAPLTRRLLAVSADLATLAGWFAFDDRRVRLADRYFNASLRLAHAAEDRQLEGALATLIAIRYYADGLAREGAEIVAGARVRIDAAAAPNLATTLLLTEARCHAQAGNRRRLDEVVERAHERFAAGLAPTEPRSLSPVTVGEFHGQVGSALLDIGSHAQAATELARAQGQYANDEIRSNKLHTVRLATAHARAGEPEYAVAALERVVSDPSPVWSRRYDHHLRDLADALQPAATAHPVREALSEIRRLRARSRTPLARPRSRPT